MAGAGQGGHVGMAKGAKRPFLTHVLLPNRSLDEQLALRLPAPHRQHEGPAEQGAR